MCQPKKDHHYQGTAELELGIGLGCIHMCQPKLRPPLPVVARYMPKKACSLQCYIATLLQPKNSSLEKNTPRYIATSLQQLISRNVDLSATSLLRYNLRKKCSQKKIPPRYIATSLQQLLSRNIDLSATSLLRYNLRKSVLRKK